MHFSSYLRNTTVDKDFVSCEVESSTMEVEDFSLVGNGNRKIFEKALQIRMLKQILLGFKICHCQMSEGVMAVVKPEMKSYIWLQTADGSIQQVEEEVAMFCPMICREILQTGMGSSKNYAISLPQRVNPAILGLILDYCRFHQVPGRSNKERKTFDEKFIRMDTKKLCELTSAADSLQLKPLVDLTSRALARIIEGKSPEEIRETFHLPDDLTEEEKLEPLRNITDDPRIRLLNRLYARKRKELKEREKLKSVEAEGERIDERSVDDLLTFINGGNRETKGIKTNKNKKKNRRRKDHPKDSSTNVNGHNKDLDALSSASQDGDTINVESPSPSSSKLQDSTSVTFSPKLDFDDGDLDDDLDPAMKEELDREVEDFARRLNSDWPERMQEILSLGQERKLAPIDINGNGSARRYKSISTVLLILFGKLTLQPLNNGEYPPGIIENRHENTHSFHEHLTCEEKNVRRSGADAFFIAFENALENVGNGEQKADDGAQAEDFVFGVENCGVFRGTEGGECNFGDEVHVDHGEDNEGKVLGTYHAAGGEDDDDGEGVELPEGEHTATGFPRRGGGAGV
ncbi:hypothetical protein DVH24_024774 [Malus domestica]|uniref:SKP1 component dimerisation domain-containing protein n=1 Tax=Malus domestica TaxID=3750 RepID=A0A498JHP6_MALDO|nr:hypothetical protein DVH24_024774 [Malus domestica]